MAAQSNHKEASLTANASAIRSTPASRSTAARYASDPDPTDPNATTRRLDVGPINFDLPMEERPGELLRLANEAFTKTTSWVVFYREIMGVDGVCRKLFPEPEQMRYLEQSEIFSIIQEMIAGLRGQDSSKGDAEEPERMITIRIPRSVHDHLCLESEELGLSINKLCITKMLQRVDARHIPEQRGRRRGRRPGPQKPVESKVEVKRFKKDQSGQWSEGPSERS